MDYLIIMTLLLIPQTELLIYGFPLSRS